MLQLNDVSKSFKTPAGEVTAVKFDVWRSIRQQNSPNG